MAIADRVTDLVKRQVGEADLDDRDTDYIRETLPLAWLFATLWHRAEVRGLELIPKQGPVLLVGNHSGGNMSPDMFAFTLAFIAYFGVERRFYQLAHDLVIAAPLPINLRKFGALPAGRGSAEKALADDAAVLVYPGGDYEVHRPTWETNKVDFGGRKGFIRLAIARDVPVVPVVSIGGQETALFLGQGQRISRLLRLDRALRLKVFPVQVAPPFGVTLLDLPLRMPLPSKITIRVLPPIDLRAELGPDADPEQAYEIVTEIMQAELAMLSAERTLPVIG